MNTSTLAVRVHAIRCEAEGVVSLELRPIEPGAQLPAFSPGSHIDLHLPIGPRCYSLTNCATERHRYVVAVGLAARSSGGSEHVHRSLAVGETLQISVPRNLFALDERAADSVLIAGGIGITPIRCMFDHLRSNGRTVRLLYCARSRRHAAFANELEGQPGVRLHFDDEAGGAADLTAYLSGFGSGTSFYCCGPAPMLAAFEAAGARLGIAAERLHLERFAPVQAAAPPVADYSCYTVELARSGRTLVVRRNESILQSLLAAGLAVDYSCQQGNCGACETVVLEGEPDHRDSVLTEAERQAHKLMMICVSGCKGSRIVLDR